MKNISTWNFKIKKMLNSLEIDCISSKKFFINKKKKIAPIYNSLYFTYYWNVFSDVDNIAVILSINYCFLLLNQILWISSCLFK